MKRNKQIVIINGMARSGKDTFVNICDNYVNVKNVSSVDKIKEIARRLGWQGEKTNASRKFLSELKRITTEYNDFAFEEITREVKRFYRDNKHDILFIHIREPHEINKLIRYLNKNCFTSYCTLFIENNNVEQITTNTSDENVYDYAYDYWVCNNGTLSELDECAFRFLNELGYNII